MRQIKKEVLEQLKWECGRAPEITVMSPLMAALVEEVITSRYKINTLGRKCKNEQSTD